MWCAEDIGRHCPFSERVESPLVSARWVTIPVRPAPSNARTATATTETITGENGLAEDNFSRGVSSTRKPDRLCPDPSYGTGADGFLEKLPGRAATTMVATNGALRAKGLPSAAGPVR